MFRPISKFALATFSLSVLLIFGCSSDDGGGGTVVNVPANAVTITEANAKDTVAEATLGGSVFVDSVPIGVSTEQAVTASDIIKLARAEMERISDLAIDLPVAEVIEYPCQSGSITANFTETDTTLSGTFVFNDCFVEDTTLSGSISFNASINLTTRDYALNMTGNLSGTDSVTTTTLSGLVYNETGNELTYEYSINSYTFTIDYSGGGGFFAQLLAPIIGNEMQFCPNNPRSGVIQVIGANNTKAKGTINADGTVTIEYDDGSGVFVEVTEPPPGSPYPCSEFFI